MLLGERHNTASRLVDLVREVLHQLGVRVGRVHFIFEVADDGVEVIEDFPSRYDVVAKRQHRWTWGDWQLLPWVFGRRSAGLAVPAIGRWKMLDNLRRSLLSPALVIALGVCWLLPAGSALAGIAFVLATVAIPAFLPSLFSVLPSRRWLLSGISSSP